MSVTSILLVMAGGFAGAVSRYCMGQLAARLAPGFPAAGTFIVNIAGAFLLGFALANDVPQSLMLLLGSGYLGALTTYSTLHLECVRLYMDKRRLLAFVYMMMTYAVGVAAAAAGYSLGDL